MPKLPSNPVQATEIVRKALRSIGVRELARRTGIPLTTVGRAILHVERAPFERVMILLEAARPK